MLNDTGQTDHPTEFLRQLCARGEQRLSIIVPFRSLSNVPFQEEDKVKEASRSEAIGEGEAEDERTATSVAAKTLCKPVLGQAGLPEVPPIEGLTCFFSRKPAKEWVLWGRSY